MKKFVLLDFAKYSRLIDLNASEDNNNSSIVHDDKEISPENKQELKCTNVCDFVENNLEQNSDDIVSNNEQKVITDNLINNQAGGRNKLQSIPPPGLPPKENKVVTVFKSIDKPKNIANSNANWNALWKKY